ncbi:MAG: hypothetical protein J6V77_00045, partial [Clostridia bacterium]|nr:hypothetical protein [Clostridia bacterium]
MNLVKYILHCIDSILSVIAASPRGIEWKEGTIGISAIVFAALVFFVSLAILHKKTSLSSQVNIVCSVCLTILVIGIIFAIMILVEYLIQR